MWDKKEEQFARMEMEARKNLCGAMYVLIGKSERGEVSFADMRGEIELIATLERLLAEEININIIL